MKKDSNGMPVIERNTWQKIQQNYRRKGKEGKMHSSAQSTAAKTGVIRVHDYTDQFKNVDEQHKSVFCQTELTMEDLAKMERGMSSTSTSAPSQEIKFGTLNSQRRREQVVQEIMSL